MFLYQLSEYWNMPSNVLNMMMMMIKELDRWRRFRYGLGWLTINRAYFKTQLINWNLPQHLACRPILRNHRRHAIAMWCFQNMNPQMDLKKIHPKMKYILIFSSTEKTTELGELKVWYEINLKLLLKYI